MTRLDRLQDVFSQIATPFYVLRAPLIAVIIATAFLALPDQALEIYRALALDLEGQSVQISLAIGTLVLACLIIWYIGRNLTLIWQQRALTDRGLEAKLLRWMPRVIASLPFVGAAIGLVRAAQDIPNIRVPSSIEEKIPGLLDDIIIAEASLNHAVGVLKTGAWIMVLFALGLIVLTHLRSLHRNWVHEQPNPLLFSVGTRSALTMFALLFSFALGAFFFLDPISLTIVAGDLGALAIFNIFILCFTFTLAFLTNIYDRTNVPMLSILVIVGLVSTGFNLNDNHEIRTLDREMLTDTAGPEQTPIARPNLEQERRRRIQSASNAFIRWLDARPDKDFYWDRGLDYPVYVVAAQGGGLYAAHHAATALARMQDRCAGFAQHVFAMSGVSGGSLGISLFAALVQSDAEPVTQPNCKLGPVKETPYANAVDRYLDQDFMAPLTAAGFFPDLAQRFLPFPIQRFDRARALEAGFEQAWTVAKPDAPRNPFAESYNDAWEPASLHPAVILNTTAVSTGERIVFSPFSFQGETSDRIQVVSSLLRRPIALSTAVGVSARFPWILPAATIERQVGQRVDPRRVPKRQSERQIMRQKRVGELDKISIRLVDGGYFEYSGVETALDIMQMIEQLQQQFSRYGEPRLKVKVNLIVMTDDEIAEDATTSDAYVGERRAVLTGQGFGEAAAPIRALLSSRISRGTLSVSRAVDKLCPGCFRSRRDLRSLPGFDGEARLIRLNQTDFTLTLGWKLSPVSRKIIAVHTGEADKCYVAQDRPEDRTEAPDAPDAKNWFAEVVNENNCAACRMVYDLNAEPTQIAIASVRGPGGIDPGRVVKLHPYSIRVPAGGGLLCR